MPQSLNLIRKNFSLLTIAKFKFVLMLVGQVNCIVFSFSFVCVCVFVFFVFFFCFALSVFFILRLHVNLLLICKFLKQKFRKKKDHCFERYSFVTKTAIFH